MLRYSLAESCTSGGTDETALHFSCLGPFLLFPSHALPSASTLSFAARSKFPMVVSSASSWKIPSKPTNSCVRVVYHGSLPARRSKRERGDSRGTQMLYMTLAVVSFGGCVRYL